MSGSGDNLVLPVHGCPLCGERDCDRLVWIDDDRVECTMCGSVYAPGGDDDDRES